MKWYHQALAVIAFLLVAVWIYAALFMNRGVIEQLEQDPAGTTAARVLLLTLPDGKSVPVNYLEEGETFFVGADGLWWRALRAPDSQVELLVRGQRLQGRARVILDDADYTRRIFNRLRPDVPAWLPDWLNAKLIVIKTTR